MSDTMAEKDEYQFDKTKHVISLNKQGQSSSMIRGINGVNSNNLP